MLVVLLPIRTKAIHEVIDSRCTDELKISLREEASLLTYRLSKVEKKGNVTYTLYFYNISDNLYVLDTKTNKKYYKNDKIEDINPGTILNLDIYAIDSSYCKTYKPDSRSIRVPYYNKFSTSELCIGHKEYALCKEDINVTLTEEQFKESLNKYIESLEQKRTTTTTKQTTNEGNKFNIFDFIIKYNEYISAFGVLLLIIYIVVDIKITNKKRRSIL